jgi:predicted PurR-regulated permease PerM
MTLLQMQSINNGSLSADWTLNGSFIIIGGLLVLIAGICGWVFVSSMNSIKEEIKNIHKRINTREDEHDKLGEKHTEITTRVTIMEAHQKLVVDKMADAVVSKMRLSLADK